MALIVEMQVHRRIIACARCRRRKIRCDGKTPKCTTCALANAECVGTDGQQKDIPRSLVGYLEERVRQLEARQQASPRARNSGAYIVERAFDASPGFFGFCETITFPNFVVAGSQAPTLAKQREDEHPFFSVVLTSGAAEIGLRLVRRSEVNYLTKKFIDNVLPQYPALREDEIWHMYNEFYAPAASPSIYINFILSLIIAISLTTAAQTNHAQALATSQALFHAAIKDLPNVITNNLSGFRALLLLQYYGARNPNAANPWFLSGYVAQACTELGLHTDPLEHLNPLERDIRRAAFWCAWEMDVSVCSALLRPMSLGSLPVQVGFPSGLEDACITPEGITNDGLVTKFFALGKWKFRQIEAECFLVLFYAKPIPDYASLDDWMEATRRRLQEWREEIFISAGAHCQSSSRARGPSYEEVTKWADIAYDLGLTLIYRPSPRIRQPPTNNLLLLFEAACSEAKGYYEQSQLKFGSSKNTWHSVHHSFEAAKAALYSLRHCKLLIFQKYPLDVIRDMLSYFALMFSNIAERWPASAKCKEEFERQLDPVMTDFLVFAQKQQRGHDELDPVMPSAIPDALELDLWEPTVPLFENTIFGNSSALDPQFAFPHDWNEAFDFQ